jgi:hypothetical protein
MITRQLNKKIYPKQLVHSFFFEPVEKLAKIKVQWPFYDSMPKALFTIFKSRIVFVGNLIQPPTIGRV